MSADAAPPGPPPSPPRRPSGAASCSSASQGLFHADRVAQRVLLSVHRRGRLRRLRRRQQLHLHLQQHPRPGDDPGRLEADRRGRRPRGRGQRAGVAPAGRAGVAGRRWGCSSRRRALAASGTRPGSRLTSASPRSIPLFYADLLGVRRLGERAAPFPDPGQLRRRLLDDEDHAAARLRGALEGHRRVHRIRRRRGGHSGRRGARDAAARRRRAVSDRAASRASWGRCSCTRCCSTWR